MEKIRVAVFEALQFRNVNPDEQFEVIVSEHYEPLFRFAMSLTRSESDAWDLTQQTFSVWAAKGHQLRDFSKVKSWLFTTLHRLFLNLRSRGSRFSQSLDEVPEQLMASVPDYATQLDIPWVLAALSRVNQTYQAAVALFYLEDYSYREIAAILDVPIGTVQSRIARGIAQLKEILIAEGSLDPCPHDAEKSRASSDTLPQTSKTEGFEETLPAGWRGN